MAAQNQSRFPGNGQSSLEMGQPPKEATTAPFQPIKISPPSQFDHSRPFMFNGQVVYPVPAGFQPPANSVPLPITVLGDPNLPHQASVPTTGSFLPSQYPVPVPMGNFSNPFMIPLGPANHLQMMTPHGVQPLEAVSPLPAYLPQPVPGLVSLSELTKVQIQGFRNQVKHIDNQLANNKHQVDEPFLQRQRSELIVFIEKMKTMLETQLGQEGNESSLAHLNGTIGDNNTVYLNQNNAGETLPNVESGAEDDKLKISYLSLAGNEELKGGSTSTAGALAPPVPLFVPKPHASTIQDKTADFQAVKMSAKTKSSTRSEPGTKSRLTAAAAMAPPFQPRAHTMTQPSLSESEPASDVATRASSLEGRPVPILPAGLPASAIAYSQLGPRRLANFSADQPVMLSGAGHASLSRAHTVHAPYMLDGNYSGLFQRSNTFHAQPTTREITGVVPAIAPSVVPYLVGVLPQGIHISEARGSDFVYSRPLTDAEVRARHLYWGDAPRSALKGSGLPKFDGKDFYPPSPVKEMVGPASPASRSIANQRSTTVPLPDFERLFTEPGGPGYRTPPQLHPRPSLQNLMPTPTQIFLENGIIGFQSPSPRPATYRFENSGTQNWSTQSGSNADAKPTAPEQALATATTNSVSYNFSNLFLEHEAPEYKSLSPSAPQHSQSSQDFHNRGNAQPATPKNLTQGEDDEARTLDSWGAPKRNAGWVPDEHEDIASSAGTDAIKTDSQSNTSTVEIHLAPRGKEESPKRAQGGNFADRATNSNR